MLPKHDFSFEVSCLLILKTNLNLTLYLQNDLFCGSISLDKIFFLSRSDSIFLFLYKLFFDLNTENKNIFSTIVIEILKILE